MKLAAVNKYMVIIFINMGTSGQWISLHGRSLFGFIHYY